MDILTKKQRSYCMSQIRGKNTKPEILLRKMLWAIGKRGYRKHVSLPGRPDIYYPRYKVAIFYDGCFWHGCPKCKLAPNSNKDFWQNKIIDNQERDRRNRLKLKREGITIIRIWGHEFTRNPEICLKKILNKIG